MDNQEQSEEKNNTENINRHEEKGKLRPEEPEGQQVTKPKSKADRFWTSKTSYYATHRSFLLYLSRR